MLVDMCGARWGQVLLKMDKNEFHFENETAGTPGDISRFAPQIDWIFSGEAPNPFFVAQDEEFLEFRSR